jgi:hypothetical protein
MGPSIQNPVLEPLNVLIGEWTAEITFAADPSAPLHGKVSFDWTEGGAFLIMHSKIEQAGPPASVSVIGRDDSSENYSMLYFDERGVSRIYAMSLKDGVWTMWRDAPGFHQRFSGAFDDDGDTILAQWEKSSDGLSWEHDFDLTYRRTA